MWDLDKHRSSSGGRSLWLTGNKQQLHQSLTLCWEVRPGQTEGEIISLLKSTSFYFNYTLELIRHIRSLVFGGPSDTWTPSSLCLSSRNAYWGSGWRSRDALVKQMPTTPRWGWRSSAQSRAGVWMGVTSRRMKRRRWKTANRWMTATSSSQIQVD